MEQKHKKWLLAIAILLLILAIWNEKHTITSFTPNSSPEPNLSDSEQVTLLDALAECECNGCEADFKKVDTNGYYSYGKYQFQLHTFIHFATKYGFLSDDLEEADYRNWIADYSMQRKVAEKMLEEGEWAHWFTCGKRLALYDYNIK